MRTRRNTTGPNSEQDDNYAVIMNKNTHNGSVTPLEELREEARLKEAAEFSHKLVSDFNPDEQMRIAFIPLIYNSIAWRFSEEAIRLGIQYRVDGLKKLTRAIRMLRDEYGRELSRFLTGDLIRNIDVQARQFTEENADDFTVVWFTVNQMLKTACPEFLYDDLRTYALCSAFVMDVAEAHDRRMDRLIESRIEGSVAPSVRMEIMLRLHACMLAFAGESAERVDMHDGNIALCARILEKNMNGSEFDYGSDR